MQIDTWNRAKMNISYPNKFVPGPLPKHSLSPRGLDALYSGLLECPITDKVVKTIPGVLPAGTQTGPAFQPGCFCLSWCADLGCPGSAGGSGFNSTFATEIFQCPSSSNNSQPLTDQHISGYKMVTIASWPAHAFAPTAAAAAKDTEELNLFWNAKVSHGLQLPSLWRTSTAAVS